MEKNLKSQILEAQPQLAKQFQKVLKNNKLTHAYLIENQDHQMTYEFSLWLSQAIFCLNPVEGDACGNCDNCRRVESFDFPDINTIEPDGQTIKVDQIRDIKQTFIRSGMESRKKVLIIRQAEKMTVNAANGLLKFIEEPDGMMYVFFLTSNINKIIPTIQSRCQQVYLKPVPKKSIESELSQVTDFSENQIRIIAELSDSKEMAVELSKDEWFNSSKEIVSKWFQYLQSKNSLSFVFVQQHIIKIAKDKDQQFLILDLLLVLYRLELKQSIKNESIKQQELMSAIEKIIAARRKLEANVSFQNVCEQLVWQLLN
jgi:DNA polymerase-3 subunit delta'